MNFGSQARKPTVVLVTPFAGKDDYRRVERSMVQKLRNLARRSLDILKWFVAGVWEFHYSTYEDRQNCNRGDIAIRIASRSFITDAFDDNVEILEAGWDDFNLSFAQQNQQVDLVVIAGGGYLFLNGNGDLPRRLQSHLDAIEELGCPAVGLCLGVNQLLSKRETVRASFSSEASAFSRRFFQRFALMSVRDPVSLSAVRAFDGGSTVLLPDPALFLARTAISGSAVRRDDDGCLWVGINLAMHGKETAPLLKSQFPLVVDLLKSLEREQKCKFLYFVHYDTERLIPQLLGLCGLTVQVVDCSPSEMVSWYGQLDVHLAGMLHSAILACAAGTPVVHLAYDVKGIGFFESMGLSEWLIDVNQLGAANLEERMRALVLKRAQVRERIKSRSLHVRREIDDFMKRVRATVQ